MLLTSLSLYDRYLKDPESVDPETREQFAQWKTVDEPASPAGAAAGIPARPDCGAVNYAQAIREHGHLAANLDPLARRLRAIRNWIPPLTGSPKTICVRFRPVWLVDRLPRSRQRL